MTENRLREGHLSDYFQPDTLHMLKPQENRLVGWIVASVILASAGGLLHLKTVHAAGQNPSVPSSAELRQPVTSPLPHYLEGYQLPFGDSPYLPSQARTTFDGFLTPEEIPSAAYCARCHQGVHAEWRQSAHANSFRTPWYKKNVDELGTTKGVAYTRHCEGCHNPAALFSGALTADSKVPRPHDEDGVTCMVCHSIQRVDNTRGIGSYVMGKPAVLVDDAGNAIPGLPADAEINSHVDWHKRAVMRPLYKTAEFCGGCHKAAIPKMVNDYKWLRTFSTYDEWQQSSWSTETPMTFYTKKAPSGCQTCHMPREAANDVAAHEGTVASHRWLGADTAVAVQYGYDEQLKKLQAFLKEDQLQVDIFGLTVERAGKPLSAASLVAPLGTKPFTLMPGDIVRVDVVVRNKGIGHTLVPELRDFYESWLDFEAKDDTGKTIYRSGGLEKNKSVDPLAHSYTLRIVSRDGRSLDHHEVWKTYVKAYDATISPGRAEVVRYKFRIPDQAKGVTVSAAVRYWRFRKSFTDWVFGDPPDSPERFPTVTMGAGQFHLAVGENRPSGEETLAADLTPQLRWNNYGIGMIDRQQYAEASAAFRQVVALDPKYEPGYVNIAIAEYTRGRYDEALRWIDRSAAMNADDARAQYYRGLCMRWTQKYDEAIAILQPVAARYPRFRQVHQELGYLYLILRRYPEARAEYETVLAIDPDDPITHRWLGPVYAALGDKAGAAREAVLAAQTANDTASGWMAQRFWRDHLEVAGESMPWHTFSQPGLADDSDVKRVLNLQNPPSYIWIENY